MTRILLVFILLLSLFSCGESRMQKTMERIRTVSDTDTKAAARMMDNISVEVKSGTEYTRMRYDLLKIRIDDKNDVKPMSDKMIAYLVKYFEENGNNTDRQEAYFYAGSVYRDLNDTPRSIDYFQKSIDVMADSDRTDSLLMRMPTPTFIISSTMCRTIRTLWRWQRRNMPCRWSCAVCPLPR